MLFHPTSGMTIRCVEHLCDTFQDLALVFAVKPAGQGPKHLVFVHGAKYPNVLMDKFLHQLGSKQDCKLKSNNFWTLWIFLWIFLVLV